MKDVTEAEQTIQSLVGKVKDIEEDYKVIVLEKEDAYREIDGLLENIDGLKDKLSKERKDKKRLEEDIASLERKIYKELKHVKRHIAEEIEAAAMAHPPGSRILHSASYEQGKASPRVEVIL